MATIAGRLGFYGRNHTGGLGYNAEGVTVAALHVAGYAGTVAGGYSDCVVCEIARIAVAQPGILVSDFGNCGEKCRGRRGMVSHETRGTGSHNITIAPMTGIAAIGFAAVGKRDCSAFVRGSGSDRARVAQDAVSGVAVASPAVEELGLRRSRSRSPSGEVRKVVPGAGGNVCCRAIQIIGQTRRGVALLAGAAAAGVVPRVVSPHIVHAIGTRRHDGINLRFTCSGVCGSTSCPGYGVCIGSGILGSQQILMTMPAQQLWYQVKL